MKKQRETNNLGINKSRDKVKIYNYIENVLGFKNKLCSRGTSKRKSKFGISHEGNNPLPIRNFNLEGAYITPKGKVIIKKSPGLQPYCISCEKKYRRGRLNQWNNKYSKLTPKEIYQEFKKNYGNLCHCSNCGQDKIPEEFQISIGMDRGLHNTCFSCSKAYSESVGSRWVIYSPDGHSVLSITDKDFCNICGSKINLHKDHIWPIAKGGTDNKINLQVLCDKDNLSKSDSIHIKKIEDLKEGMICNRYYNLFKKAKEENWEISKFELEISKAVRDFISYKNKLNDNQLLALFEAEKIKNNRKHSTIRAVKKFREYCKNSKSLNF